jgi:hypothetical protein
MAESERRRTGRPKTRIKEKPGSYVGCRVPDSLKTELENAAMAAGRSLSTETQVRLAESFQRDAALADGQRLGLEIFYGPKGAELMALLGQLVAAGPRTFGSDWTNNPTGFALIEKRIAHALAQLRPKGDPGAMPNEQVYGPIDRLVEVAAQKIRGDQL